eukprot:CAMPEP_0178903322 /NCGR_PEP_ID=MMETSP0786-20121207/5093_1 /TAXON_ID=186022 /ORGANISM="Thalassionema frauenfeldii, Strain CCMP 1798" /LENGTH=384 /DNA_ID=CAMNT_0020574681 /DNA_START=147 /DNA_END=1301 /DNA_ORIENTATION=-
MDPALTESPSSRRIRSASTVSVASSASSVASKSKNQKSQKKSSSLPAETVDYLKAWMMSPEHVAHPYPTEQEKSQIMADTGIELKQLTNWFVNNRKRYWKPRVEARLQQQAQAQVAAVVATNNMSHVISPAGVDRATFTVPPQQAVGGAPYIALDMTKPIAAKPSQTPNSNESTPTIIPSDGISAFTPASMRAVSDASSSGSDENSSLTDSQESLENGAEFSDSPTVTRTEVVDIHVLNPISGDTQSIEDVSILPNIPSSRIIRSYHKCVLEYSFHKSMADQSQKIQNLRDGEVVRLKKRYLKLFLDEKSAASSLCNRILPPRKRKYEDSDLSDSSDNVVILRPNFARKNAPATWRGACIRADHFRDASLPSLEEAARLFGYSQ